MARHKTNVRINQKYAHQNKTLNYICIYIDNTTQQHKYINKNKHKPITTTRQTQHTITHHQHKHNDQTHKHHRQQTQQTYTTQ